MKPFITFFIFSLFSTGILAQQFTAPQIESTTPAVEEQSPDTANLISPTESANHNYTCSLYNGSILGSYTKQFNQCQLSSDLNQKLFSTIQTIFYHLTCADPLRYKEKTRKDYLLFLDRYEKNAFLKNTMFIQQEYTNSKVIDPKNLLIKLDGGPLYSIAGKTPAQWDAYELNLCSPDNWQFIASSLPTLKLISIIKQNSCDYAFLQIPFQSGRLTGTDIFLKQPLGSCSEPTEWLLLNDPTNNADPYLNIANRIIYTLTTPQAYNNIKLPAPLPPFLEKKLSYNYIRVTNADLQHKQFEESQKETVNQNLTNSKSLTKKNREKPSSSR